MIRVFVVSLGFCVVGQCHVVKKARSTGFHCIRLWYNLPRKSFFFAGPRDFWKFYVPAWIGPNGIFDFRVWIDTIGTHSLCLGLCTHGIFCVSTWSCIIRISTIRIWHDVSRLPFASLRLSAHGLLLVTSKLLTPWLSFVCIWMLTSRFEFVCG